MSVVDTEDYPVRCYTGATRQQSALARAFNEVADGENWKFPVDARLAFTADLCLYIDAIVHFTGSLPTFEVTADGFQVTANGYYRTIGA